MMARTTPAVRKPNPYAGPVKIGSMVFLSAGCMYWRIKGTTARNPSKP